MCFDNLWPTQSFVSMGKQEPSFRADLIPTTNYKIKREIDMLLAWNTQMADTGKTSRLF